MISAKKKKTHLPTFDVSEISNLDFTKLKTNLISIVLFFFFSAAGSNYFAIVRVVCAGVYSPECVRAIKDSLIAIFEDTNVDFGVPSSVPKRNAINIFEGVVDHHNSFSVYAYLPVEFAKMLPYIQGRKHKSTLIMFIAYELGGAGWPLVTVGE